MQPQPVPLRVLVDQDLVGRVFGLKEATPLDSFIYYELQVVEGEVVLGLRWLEDMVWHFGLEVLDAVVLLFPPEVFAPGVRVDGLQHLLFLLEGDEVPEVEEARDELTPRQQHGYINSEAYTGQRAMQGDKI